jgi:hypothetical protein
LEESQKSGAAANMARHARNPEDTSQDQLTNYLQNPRVLKVKRKKIWKNPSQEWLKWPKKWWRWWKSSFFTYYDVIRNNSSPLSSDNWKL